MADRSAPFKLPVRLETSNRVGGRQSFFLVADDVELICELDNATLEEAEAIVRLINLGGQAA